MLADALHRLQDPALRARLADGALRAYEEQFSPAAIGARLRATLEAIV